MLLPGLNVSRIPVFAFQIELQLVGVGPRNRWELTEWSVCKAYVVCYLGGIVREEFYGNMAERRQFVDCQFPNARDIPGPRMLGLLASSLCIFGKEAFIRVYEKDG